jgi:hypothetical protein
LEEHEKMGRVSAVSADNPVQSAWGNAFRADYLSQTDTAKQAIASILEWAAGKNPKFPFAHFDPTTVPASIEGYLYFDTATKKWTGYDGTNWVSIPAASGGGTGKLAPTYTVYKTGSTYYAEDADGNVDYSGSVFPTVINNASAAITTNGGWIHIKAGTYTWTTWAATTAGCFYLYNNIAYTGDGNGTLIQIPMPTHKRGGVENKNLRTATQDHDIYFGHMKIDGQDLFDLGNHYGCGIHLEGVKNVLVEHTTVVDCTDIGMRMRADSTKCAAGSENIIVKNCTFDGCWNNAMVLSGEQEGIMKYSAGIQNYATDCDTAFSIYCGYHCHYFDCQAYNNNNDDRFAGNNSPFGIEGDDTPDRYSKYCSIQNCSADYHEGGIGGHHMRWCLFANNIVTRSNLAAGHGNYGLNTGQEAYDCAFIGNYIYDCDQGVGTGTGIDGVGGGHLIMGNYIENWYSADAGRHAISVLSPSTAPDYVLNNFIKDSGSAQASGIYIVEDGCLVEGNTLIDSDGANMNIGIRLEANNIICKRNYLKGMNTGISTLAGKSGIVVKDNDFDGCTANISDAATGTKFNQRVFHSILDDTDPNAYISNENDMLTLTCHDGHNVTVRFNFICPDDFTELMSAKLKVFSPCTAGTVMRWNVATDFGADDELYSAHTDSIASTDQTMAINMFEALDLTAAFTAMAAGDNVGVAFQREGAHANDTLGDRLQVHSFVINYI